MSWSTAPTTKYACFSKNFNDILATVLWIAFGSGWLLLFVAALSIDLLELLGMRQAWAWFTRREPTPLALKTNWLYRYIEHPMYVGVVLGFWMTPLMTVGHAALAAQLTLYIVIAMSFERRDLRARFGAQYDEWRERRSAPPLPEFAKAIAWEPRRRYRPLSKKPLTLEMRSLLERLP